MVLSALQYYAKVPGPYADKSRQIYVQLRTNLITNMFRIYEKTGHIWEQYDDKTGHGHGSHPFTGWSSLILLIMSELFCYLNCFIHCYKLKSIEKCGIHDTVLCTVSWIPNYFTF